MKTAGRVSDSQRGAALPRVLDFEASWLSGLSHVRLLVTPWTAAYQAPPSMGFSRQEYWSGVPAAGPDFSQATVLSSLGPKEASSQ